ncbi:hypothetical protein EDD18DRAFT_1331045 [Armillaria luteobubalina]|uniref:Uncharacterized protein n=1 Tax=Armillaria luteobubalina TaxID=153913 RepID=A0AA39UUK1_9AGAR|nr:hypothetical protein EDD18DRAFT_1331045 [Armillaria luteobubalina]
MSGNTFWVYKELPPRYFNQDGQPNTPPGGANAVLLKMKYEEESLPLVMHILWLIHYGLARSPLQKMRDHYISVLRGTVSIDGPAVTHQEREEIHEFFSQHFPPVYLSQALDIGVYGEVFRGDGYGCVIFINYDLAVAENAVKSIPESTNTECASILVFIATIYHELAHVYNSYLHPEEFQFATPEKMRYNKRTTSDDHGKIHGESWFVVEASLFGGIVEAAYNGRCNVDFISPRNIVGVILERPLLTDLVDPSNDQVQGRVVYKCEQRLVQSFFENAGVFSPSPFHRSDNLSPYRGVADFLEKSGMFALEWVKRTQSPRLSQMSIVNLENVGVAHKYQRDLAYRRVKINGNLRYLPLGAPESLSLSKGCRRFHRRLQ